MPAFIGALVLAAYSAASYRSHHPLPPERVPDGWGVNIHFTEPQAGELEQIARVFKWVRMDFFWNGIEKTRGRYDFSPYDRLMAGLDRAGLRPIFILDYGNDLYESGSPRNEESRAAFCRFVKAAVSHFRHRGVVWEMWNEPNISFWQPHPNVEEYMALALATGKTIRSAAADEWFIGPATSGFDWTFLARCFDAGLLGFWDAVSVHPYRGDPPETAGADWRRLRSMIDSKTPKGRRIPMFSGEWGYSRIGGVTEELQADYIVRQYLSNLEAGVPLSIWYDWKDDGRNPAEIEHHFGTTLPDRTPKPAYEAALRLAESLRGYRLERRIEMADPRDRGLLFQRGRSRRLAIWTTGSEHQTALSLRGFPSSAVVRPLPDVLTGS